MASSAHTPARQFGLYQPRRSFPRRDRAGAGRADRGAAAQGLRATGAARTVAGGHREQSPMANVAVLPRKLVLRTPFGIRIEWRWARDFWCGTPRGVRVDTDAAAAPRLPEASPAWVRLTSLLPDKQFAAPLSLCGAIRERTEPPVMRRKATESDGARRALSEAQLTAVELIVAGRNLAAVARTLDVVRQTVSAWYNKDPEFRAAPELNGRRCRSRPARRSRARAAVATEALEEGLRGANRLQAAVHVIKA